jgi:hypothetical protein
LRKALRSLHSVRQTAASANQLLDLHEFSVRIHHGLPEGAVALVRLAAAKQSVTQIGFLMVTHMITYVTKDLLLPEIANPPSRTATTRYGSACSKALNSKMSSHKTFVASIAEILSELSDLTCRHFLIALRNRKRRPHHCFSTTP